MTIDERSRHALYLRLEEVLGADEAGTLMEHLPPVGWADVATRRDLISEIGMVRSDLISEIGLVRSDLTAEIGALRNEMTVEFASVRAECGSIRVDLAQTFATQTRTLVVAMITLFVAGMSLAFAAARLG